MGEERFIHSKAITQDIGLNRSMGLVLTVWLGHAPMASDPALIQCTALSRLSCPCPACPVPPCPAHLRLQPADACPGPEEGLPLAPHAPLRLKGHRRTQELGLVPAASADKMQVRSGLDAMRHQFHLPSARSQT